MSLKVLESIEREIDRLEIRDVWGGRIEPIIASGALARFHGDKWESLVNSFEAGEVSAEEYQKQAIELITEYGRFRFRSKLERRLLDLGRDQVELDLVSNAARAKGA